MAQKHLSNITSIAIGLLYFFREWCFQQEGTYVSEYRISVLLELRNLKFEGVNCMY
jgi:hypothetical protein